MRILHVVNMYPSDKNIYNGIFIKDEIEYYESVYKDDCEIIVIQGQRSKLNYFWSIFWINWVIARGHFDLIHIHFGLSGIFLLFNPWLKTPVVVTLHGSDIQTYKKKEGVIQKITKLVVRRASRTIVQNDNMMRILHEDCRKLVKRPCGINIPTFTTPRKNTGETFVVGFPSDKRRPEKNYDLFESVIDQLKAKGYRLDVVEFINFTRHQVVSCLSTLDCLLMTSLSEGSPQIIKEAMACNVPIVSSNVGDVQYLLCGVDNCSVIDSFEIDPFVTKIENLLRLNSCDRKTNGRKRIEELHLDMESTIRKIHQLYNEVINEHHNH